ITGTSPQHLAHLFYGKKGGFGAPVSDDEAIAHFIKQEAGSVASGLTSVDDVDGSGHRALVIGDHKRAVGRGALYVLGGGTPYHGDVDVDVEAGVLFGGTLREVLPGCPGGCDVGEGIGGWFDTGDLDGDGHPDVITADVAL